MVEGMGQTQASMITTAEQITFICEEEQDLHLSQSNRTHTPV